MLTSTVRLLLLTGARKGETLAARWADFDLDAGVCVKSSVHTKQKTDHRVPLSPPALVPLAGMKVEADRENARRANDGLAVIKWVFPSVGCQPLGNVKHFWTTICRKARLGEWIPKPDARGRAVKDANGKPVRAWRGAVHIHDLRHTYASILASSGLSLPIIGLLLGHTQTATTLRCAGLLDSPLRQATRRAGVTISAAPNGGEKAEVVPHPARRR